MKQPSELGTKCSNLLKWANKMIQATKWSNEANSELNICSFSTHLYNQQSQTLCLDSDGLMKCVCMCACVMPIAIGMIGHYIGDRMLIKTVV